MEWQPIETAPKDETDILLAAWEDDGSYWNATGSWFFDCFAFFNCIGPDPVKLCFEPTHWMPLPLPPNVSRETQEWD
jgi:hypothetical protein